VITLSGIGAWARSLEPNRSAPRNAPWGLRASAYHQRVDTSARHLRLMTETIAAVNSTLDLEELFELIASRVAEALEADACFVYLYDEAADELVLRASCGTRVDVLTRVPKMRPGEGITGAAAADRRPVMIARDAHLDPRFKAFPNLHEEEYQSILAVPILFKDRLEGALNVRTRSPRSFWPSEVDLLVAIAGQVAQAIENAKLYDHAQRRVAELEALSRISEAVSQSLYLEESLERIVETTMVAVGASGASLVLEDGRIAWPEGRPGAHALRVPLLLKGRRLGELVVERDSPFAGEEERLLGSIANQAAVALEHGRAVMREVLAQEIHHRVKNNLQTVASLLRLQAASGDADPRQALADSVNRILAIAAVHEALTHRRDDEVDLGELIERLGTTIREGLGSGKRVDTSLERVHLPGNRATALALVFTELLQNALEHGGGKVRVSLTRVNGHVSLAVEDDGAWAESAGEGTGLSIVRALVRDELLGDLTLTHGSATRAEVVF
jgi:two-component sensor histidine kinase/putative methionine-R-sulfoxide reductase with GAF domain